VSASGKPSPPHSPLFFATSSVPSHLTPPLSLYAGPRASPGPRAAPQPEGSAHSLLLSPTSPSSALLALIQRLGPCQAGAPRSMDASRGHLPAGRLVVGCHWQRQRRALRVVWTSTWCVHGLRFRPCRARWHPIARVISCVQLGRWVATGEPPGAKRVAPSVRCARAWAVSYSRPSHVGHANQAGLALWPCHGRPSTRCGRSAQKPFKN
jgi:hypothetical protein